MILGSEGGTVLHYDGERLSVVFEVPGAPLERWQQYHTALKILGEYASLIAALEVLHSNTPTPSPLEQIARASAPPEEVHAQAPDHQIY